jgi:peptide/nickel transport system permease protein
MMKYVIQRILQAIPLLTFISVILFVLMQSAGDPISMMGGRQPPKAEDQERMRRQLGLDRPILEQYLYWLIGNDWVVTDEVIWYQIDKGDNVLVWVPESQITEMDESSGSTVITLANRSDVRSGPGGKYDPAGRLTGSDLVFVTEDVVEEKVYGTRKGFLRGDFGNSLVARRPALDLILDRLPNTIILMGIAEIVIILVALLVGVISAVRQYSRLDNILTTLAFITYSVPIFLMALILMFIFAVNFREWGLPYFPISGMYDPIVGQTIPQVLWHLILPMTSIALISIAGYSRYIRSTMLEVINSDYIRTARSKGIHERRILFVHAFKNASLPLVTLIGLDLPFLLAGAVVTETIYAWPGMGRLFIDHLTRLDYPVLMGILMMISVAVVIFQLLTDIVYTWLDPRIRY